MLNNSNIDIQIECGEKGVGKTTYVKQKWDRYLFLACGNPLNQIKTTAPLFSALSAIYDTVTDDFNEIVKYLREAFQSNYVIIIDEAEYIDNKLLEIIVNTAILHKNSKIIFTFDIEYQHIYDSSIFRKLIEWDLVPSKKQMNFRTDTEKFVSVIKNAIPEAGERLINELIRTSNYNFYNLNTLLWLVQNKQADYTKIHNDVIVEYSCKYVEKKLSNLSTKVQDVLAKSSLIGEMFQSSILESTDGFNVSGVKTYLDTLEQTSMFIQSYLEDDTYQFISKETYTGVLKNIDPGEKIDLQRILLKYYMTKLAIEREDSKILLYMQQLKRLSYELNDHKIMLFIDKKLFFWFIKIGDILKAKNILADILLFFKEHSEDNMLYLYLIYYKIRLDMSTWDFKDALEEIAIAKKKFSNDNNLYLQYYYAKSLYGVGAVDQSYIETKQLVSTLKATSIKAIENQPLYALTYSLFASIQHHFGIEDYGNKYYTLALNHSKEKLKDKAIYFEILKKCDMYYKSEHSHPLLLQCISYYESVGNRHYAAEVYTNLATEMMFTDKVFASKSEDYIKKAANIFSSTPNESLVYTQNNWAILKIIQAGDFPTALSLLEKSLLVGLSSFTNMTLYLNLCMCHLILNGSESREFNGTYIKFCEYHAIIKNRDNSTQYENIYKNILDILVLEHQGLSQKVSEKVNLLLSDSPTEFFKPILKDIKIRNTVIDHEKKQYTDNLALYETFHKYKVFFAEFRFWE